jgi:hypothetical protein
MPNRQSFGWQQSAAALNYAGLSATAAGAAVCTREIDSLDPAGFTVWVADCLPSTTHLLTPSSPLYSTSPAPGLNDGFLTLTSNHGRSSSLDGTFIAYGIVDQY